MPVTTAAITSRRARRARRSDTSRYHFPSSLPRSHSELRNPAASHWTQGSNATAQASSRPVKDTTVEAKTVVVVGFVEEVDMEGGEAQTLAMTHSNPPVGNSRTISVPSSNECSPTSTRPPVPGGNGDDSPQGIERSFKRRRSFSKSNILLCTWLIALVCYGLLHSVCSK